MPLTPQSASLTASKVALTAEARRARLVVAQELATKSAFTPITEVEAHPGVCTLFFRFYDEDKNHAMNLPLSLGFTAGRDGPLYGPIAPPPLCTDLRMFNDVEVSCLNI